MLGMKYLFCESLMKAFYMYIFFNIPNAHKHNLCNFKFVIKVYLRLSMLYYGFNRMLCFYNRMLNIHF